MFANKKDGLITIRKTKRINPIITLEKITILNFLIKAPMSLIRYLNDCIEDYINNGNMETNIKIAATTKVSLKTIFSMPLLVNEEE
jgi:hypothetical protein